MKKWNKALALVLMLSLLLAGCGVATTPPRLLPPPGRILCRRRAGSLRGTAAITIRAACAMSESDLVSHPCGPAFVQMIEDFSKGTDGRYEIVPF
jgi:hypothetical protein